MSQTGTYLTSFEPRARWMRLDTAQILKRFFFCERALLVSEAAWLPLIGSLEIKTGLPRFIWQSAQAAHQLRERVFELRFPNRMIEEEGPDEALVEVFNNLKDAPSVSAFLHGAATVLVPALRDVYRTYLAASDPIADGPTHRFLSQALSEKAEQEKTLRQWADSTWAEEPESHDAAIRWTKLLAERLAGLGGVGTDTAVASSPAAPVPGSRPYRIPDRPARDRRFWSCRFYWPDNVDPEFPYGDGIRLQLRSAVSHLNEAWAVETGGLILSAFAGVLPWEWIHDAARWTYDESRHCRMGYERLMAWGLDPRDIPLGTYIYESAACQDPIYRLGMLFFFETKNIRHKPARTRMFHSYGDVLSEHDMDFDWADEAIHAGYGKHWLKELLAVRGEDPASYERVRERCGQLVSDCLRTARPEEVAEVKRVANALIEKASQRLLKSR
ncbi:MAG: DUF455 family protein [Terriglobia bacterium]